MPTLPQVLALALPGLIHLDMGSCAALRYLRLRCPQLAAIQAQDCKLLPFTYLLAAVESCSVLRSIDLQHSRLGQQQLAELGLGGMVRVGHCPASCCICRHR